MVQFRGMGQLTLHAVTRTQGATRALKDGSISPAGYDLAFEEVPVLIHASRRMVRDPAYDVTEMAFTTYLVARAHGKPFTALPVFLVRGFHHGAGLPGVASPAVRPPDLGGARPRVQRGCHR